MASPAWYVITGAPCSGKTTLLTELLYRGYRVVPEAARTHIDEAIAAGKTLEEIRSDESAFQQAVLDRKIKIERELPRDEVIFLDRGMPDTEAYYRAHGIAVAPHVESAVHDSSYRKVFLLDPIPFQKDYARSEDEAMQQKLHSLLLESYVKHGDDVVLVPVVPLSERVALVLAALES